MPTISKQTANAARMARRMVPGFPEILRLDLRCRLCCLVTEDPKLLRDVHDRWKTGQTARALSNITKSKLAKPIDHRCFDRHLTKHIRMDGFIDELDPSDIEDAEDAAAACDVVEPGAATPKAKAQVIKTVKAAKVAAAKTIAKAESALVLMPPRPTAATAAAAASRSHLHQATVVMAAPRLEADDEDGASAYFEMRNIIDRLKQRTGQVDEHTAFMTDDGRINNYGLMMWLKMVGELRGAIETLHKMQQTDRFVKGVLQGHTKLLVQRFSEPLVSRFEATLDHLRSLAHGGAGAGGAMPTEVAVKQLEELAVDLRDIVLQAASESVRESCDIYRLH